MSRKEMSRQKCEQLFRRDWPFFWSFKGLTVSDRYCASCASSSLAPYPKLSLFLFLSAFNNAPFERILALCRCCQTRRLGMGQNTTNLGPFGLIYPQSLHGLRLPRDLTVEVALCFAGASRVPFVPDFLNKKFTCHI